LRSSGLRIAVIEAQSAQQVADRPRAYALSPLSARIFQVIGIWEQIAPAIAHFPQVILADADYPHRVVFTPADLADRGGSAVYYCAEHGVVENALQHQVAISDNVTCYYETQVQQVSYGAEVVEVVAANVQGQWRLSSSLVVAADGALSLLRQQTGIKTDGWTYWQSCITAFIAAEESHRDIAYERFWPSGPFAILPLPQNRCQIVWIAPHREAEALVALPTDQFMAEMQRRYGEQSGKLRLLSQPLMFPARLMHSRRYCQPRLVLLGDAAHCCHPVGGQGLNMGIRDAAILPQVLLKAQQQQRDLGDIQVLNRYGRRRRLENWVMLLFTDILNRTFSNDWRPIVAARRLILQLMILWPPLRQLMLRLMTGLWGTQPQWPTGSWEADCNIVITQKDEGSRKVDTAHQP
jgi:2-octaprenyl-6-methoxyphenol hydroxylase